MLLEDLSKDCKLSCLITLALVFKCLSSDSSDPDVGTIALRWQLLNGFGDYLILDAWQKHKDGFGL